MDHTGGPISAENYYWYRRIVSLIGEQFAVPPGVNMEALFRDLSQKNTPYYVKDYVVDLLIGRHVNKDLVDDILGEAVVLGLDGIAQLLNNNV